MTTATKSVPAKVAAPAAGPVAAKAAVPAVAPLDLTGATVSDGGTIRQDRTSELDKYPQITEWIKQSRADGNKVKTISVLTGGVPKLVSLLHRAASVQNVGVRVGKPEVLKDKAGYSALSFVTKDPVPDDVKAARKIERAKRKADKASASASA